ncbi:MAG: hypothetical protein JST30_02355 [Armatimonadetes bacterium]|nr:hypothetical protein [Armatimonadota bacterium]
MKTLPFLLALAAFAVGCNNGPTAKIVGSGGQAKADPSADGKPAVPTVPADYKHDAYELNGFERTKPLKYNFVQVLGESPKSGTQESVLKTVDEKGAHYTVKRGAALDAIGDEELLVNAGGVYLVSTSLGSPKEPVLLMPAKVTVGTVWDYDYVLTMQSGDTLTFKGKAKVEKEEKVKVPGGEYDCLLVSETASMDRGGNKGTVSSKTWWSKGTGVVKMKMEVKDAKGKIVASTIDLAGTGE